MIEPKYLFQMKYRTEIFFDFIATHLSVTIGRKQTLGRGEQCSQTVALNGTTFQNKPQTINIPPIQETGFHSLTGNQIVFIRSEFQPPAIEHEIKKRSAF